jgi:redox-sensing transcriptional repressor
MDRGIGLGVVAVPSAAAQSTVDRLVAAGVRGILNFAPCRVDAPRRVKVITLDIAMELARLPYYMPAG